MSKTAKHHHKKKQIKTVSVLRQFVNKPLAAKIEELEKIVASQRELLNNIEFNTQFTGKKQELFDKLYNENQEYKAGIIEKFKKSLVLAVIEQVDSAEKQAAYFSDKEFSEENYHKLLSNYSEVATDFQDMLQQQFDVRPFRSETNTPFDAKRQRALKTVPAEDETKHKLVSKSIRPGYEFVNPDGTTALLRPEMVEVYVYQSSSN